MPKRRRFTPLKKKSKITTPVKRDDEHKVDQDVSTARGRLQGALKEIMEPSPSMEESDNSSDNNKREKRTSSDSSSEEEETPRSDPPRQSYVLKLFDRSVDLSQFHENTPLYPICRAWMINQPKADYKKISILNIKEREDIPDGLELPGPEGPIVSRIPNLTEDQLSVNKDNIELNYDRPLPSKELLLSMNMKRWCEVRGAWQEQAQRVHQRYASTQDILNKMNTNGL